MIRYSSSVLIAVFFSTSVAIAGDAPPVTTPSVPAAPNTVVELNRMENLRVLRASGLQSAVVQGRIATVAAGSGWGPGQLAQLAAICATAANNQIANAPSTMLIPTDVSCKLALIPTDTTHQNTLLVSPVSGTLKP